MNDFTYSAVNCLFTNQPIKTFDDLSEAMRYVEEIDKSNNKRWFMTDDGWIHTAIEREDNSNVIRLYQIEDYGIIRNHPYAVRK